jgi:uncharacterized protein YprB with RNaseH-like and TPR domain
MSETKETAKILIWDIETRGLVADYGTIFCIGWKFLGDTKVQVKSIHDIPGKHPLDDKPLIQWFIDEVWANADIAVGWYSSGHDEPFLRTRAIIHEFPAPKPVQTLDLWGKVWKRFKFSKNSLHNVARKLGLTPKWYNEDADFEKVLYGDKAAMKRIVKHCRIDVQITEEAYEKFKGYILTHPRVSVNPWKCRTCGSSSLQRRGWRYSAQKGKQQLVWCKKCKSWDQKNLKELGQADGETR